MSTRSVLKEHALNEVQKDYESGDISNELYQAIIRFGNSTPLDFASSFVDMLSESCKSRDFEATPDPDDTIGDDSDSDPDDTYNPEAEIEGTFNSFEEQAEYLEDESPYSWLSVDNITPVVKESIVKVIQKHRTSTNYTNLPYDTEIEMFGDLIDRVIMSQITQLSFVELHICKPNTIAKIRSLVYHNLCMKHKLLESIGILQQARLANADTN